MSDIEKDPLLEQLHTLPTRKNEHDPLPKARAAFDRAHGRKAEDSEALSFEPGANGTLAARAVVPVALAVVVAGYLLWAFSAAFALQG